MYTVQNKYPHVQKNTRQGDISSQRGVTMPQGLYVIILCLVSPCENYFHTTRQSDWYLLNFDLSWLIFTCYIIEYRAKFDKSYLSLWEVNPTFLPVADKFCLSLTCDRQGFTWNDHWHNRNDHGSYQSS